MQYVVTLLLCAGLALAQTPSIFDLTPTPDGSALYFTSTLTQPGYNQSTRSKIFRLTPTGLELVIDVAPPGPNDGDQWRWDRGASAPVLDSNGWLVGWSVMDRCRDSLNFICPFQIAFRIRSYLNNRLLLQHTSAITSAPLYSTSLNYAAQIRYQGLGVFGYFPLEVPTGKFAAVSVGRYFSPMTLINNEGDLYTYDSDIAAVRVYPFRWAVPVAPSATDLPQTQAVSATIHPITNEYILWRRTTQGPGLRLDAYLFDGVILRQRSLMEHPMASCNSGQIARNGQIVMLCDSITPFSITKEGTPLEPLPLNLSKPQSWALSANGEVLWILDSRNRILQYFLTTGELRTRLDGDLR